MPLQKITKRYGNHMTTQPPTERRPVSQILATGAMIAAAALLLTNAVLMLLEGISAVFNDELLVAGVPDYVYKLNTTTWGWVHIAVAILMGLVAIMLFFGAMWARVAAIVMASVSIVVMFMALPYYSDWANVVIALNVIVIWTVAIFFSVDRTRV